jgi:hypothetical protein
MASNFERLRLTIANAIRGIDNLQLTVIERKSGWRLDKDVIPAIYVAPVSEEPVGYAFGGVVIVEYAYDVVIVDKGDQKLDPTDMQLAPQRVESIRLKLDVGGFPDYPTINGSRWEMVNRLYDVSALSNNYDRTALRFWYKSDEVRSDARTV